MNSWAKALMSYEPGKEKCSFDVGLLAFMRAMV